MLVTDSNCCLGLICSVVCHAAPSDPRCDDPSLPPIFTTMEARFICCSNGQRYNLPRFLTYFANANGSDSNSETGPYCTSSWDEAYECSDATNNTRITTATCEFPSGGNDTGVATAPLDDGTLNQTETLSSSSSGMSMSLDESTSISSEDTTASSSTAQSGAFEEPSSSAGDSTDAVESSTSGNEESSTGAAPGDEEQTDSSSTRSSGAAGAAASSTGVKTIGQIIDGLLASAQTAASAQSSAQGLVVSSVALASVGFAVLLA